MKKVMNVLFLIFCVYFSGFATVNLPTQISNSTGGVNQGAALDINCDYSETFYIQVTNLDLVNGVSCGNVNELTLPASYPTLIGRFSVNGQVEMVQIDTFVLMDCVTGNGPFSTWFFEYTITIPFSEACASGDPNSGAPVNVTSELLTYDNSTSSFIPYPICAYTAYNDIFSCFYFDETQNFCTPNDPNCSNGILGTYHMEVFVSCGYECLNENVPIQPLGSNNDNTTKENKDFEEDLTQEESLTEDYFEVTPNPFINELNITWLKSFDEVSLKMYNANGLLIKSLYKASCLVDEQTIIDSSELPPGVYYISIETAAETKFIKVVKS